MSETTKSARVYVDKSMGLTALLVVAAVAIGILVAAFVPEWVVPAGIVVAVVTVGIVVARRNRRSIA